MYYMLVTCMAQPLDTGQEIATYLLLHLIPVMIYQLVFLAIPKDSMLLRILAKTLVKQAAWCLRGHPRGARPKKTKCFKKPKKKLIREYQEIQDMTIKNTLPTYLVRHSLLPSRLVVALKLNSAVSCASSSRPHGSWHSKVLPSTIQQSDLTWTHSPLGSITMHHDAWPAPPTSSRTSTSQTMRGR